jgi:hypothetical protein
MCTEVDGRDFLEYQDEDHHRAAHPLAFLSFLLNINLVYRPIVYRLGLFVLFVFFFLQDIVTKNTRL